jgi:hypothetical protein
VFKGEVNKFKFICQREATYQSKNNKAKTAWDGEITKKIVENIF